MSKTKAGGSSKNGRESHAKRLGVKAFDGQAVTAGSILVRRARDQDPPRRERRPRQRRHALRNHHRQGPVRPTQRAAAGQHPHRLSASTSFVDRVEVELRGGNGGAGVAAFARMAGKPRGKPSGGIGRSRRRCGPPGRPGDGHSARLPAPSSPRRRPWGPRAGGQPQRQAWRGPRAACARGDSGASPGRHAARRPG